MKWNISIFFWLKLNNTWQELGGKKNALVVWKPELKDLSQGSRIAFVRELRHLSQDKISEHLGKCISKNMVIDLFNPNKESKSKKSRFLIWLL